MLFKSTIELFHTLKEIGLTAKEANTYLVMQNIGTNPVSTIAKRCELNRTGCYSILNTLKEKGFAQKTIKNNISYFCPTDPKIILQRLHIKRGKIDNTINNIDSLISQFNRLQRDYIQKPNVVFFEGLEGYKSIIKNTLKTKDTIRIYSNMDEFKFYKSSFWNKYNEERILKGIKIKILYPLNKNFIFKKEDKNNALQEQHILPPKFDFGLNVIIDDNKVSITSTKENYGLTIESENMCKSYIKIFDLAWEGTKKLNKYVQKKI